MVTLSNFVIDNYIWFIIAIIILILALIGYLADILFSKKKMEEVVKPEEELIEEHDNEEVEESENEIEDETEEIEELPEKEEKKEEKDEESEVEDKEEKKEDKTKKDANEYTDFLKTRIDTLGLSTRTLNALSEANVRTIGGIARKKQEDLLEIDGIGEKGIQEIKKMLGEYGITLK